MLNLLVVLLLIGMGIACALVLILGSRRSQQRSATESRGEVTELISDDHVREETSEDAAAGREKPRGVALPSRPVSGIPRPLTQATPAAQASVNSEPGRTGPGAPAPPATEPKAEPPRAQPPTPLLPRFSGYKVVDYDPLEDEGFSEARLIETESEAAAGPDDAGAASDERVGEASEEKSSPPMDEEAARAEKRARISALMNRPKELGIEYGLPDPPLLDAWRPLGSGNAGSAEVADTASPGVQLSESFVSVLSGVSGAIDQEERNGAAVPPETHYHLGVLAYYAGQFESAVAHLQMTLDTGWEREQALNVLGLTYYQQGFEEEAEVRLREAAAGGGASPRLRGAILTNLALLATYRRAPDDALGYHGQALEVHRQQGDRQSQADTLSRMGRLCRAKGAHQEASGYHHEALELWREAGNRSEVARELRLLAAVCREKGEHAEALNLSQRALAMNRELEDHREEAINLGNIGLIYNLEKDLPKALEYYTAALSLNRKVGNHRGEANNLGNIGNVLFLLGKTEEALESYLTALKINRRIGYRWGEAVDLGNIGRIEVGQNRLAQACEHLRDAHLIFTQLNAPSQAAAIQSTLDQIESHIPEER